MGCYLAGQQLGSLFQVTVDLQYPALQYTGGDVLWDRDDGGSVGGGDADAPDRSYTSAIGHKHFAMSFRGSCSESTPNNRMTPNVSWMAVIGEVPRPNFQMEARGSVFA